MYEMVMIIFVFFVFIDLATLFKSIKNNEFGTVRNTVSKEVNNDLEELRRRNTEDIGNKLNDMDHYKYDVEHVGKAYADYRKENGRYRRVVPRASYDPKYNSMRLNKHS